MYPRCPRINGFIERANRTLQDEFIDSHLILLEENIDEFNRKLMDYLVWYNTERPHNSLNNKSAENSADYRGV
ncbi:MULTISPECIES: integrase core domain-containing protein [Caldisericum]|uniref:integrase core domain-containing protein n=1 Tax=Caldisericum TaxID=693074 RepID=UPI003C76C66D